MRSRSLLVTLDAFNTLFHPRLPVPEQYAQTAHAFGLSPSLVTSESLQPAFKAAFKAQLEQYPNYGRDLAVRGQYGGPRQWWTEVIQASFTRVLAQGGQDSNASHQLPDGLLQRLLDRFASREGYALYPDVAGFMARMREVKTKLAQRQGQYTFGPFDRVVVGTMSNSDDRISAVLKSLGLSVGDMRADQDVSSMRLPGFEERGTPSEDSNNMQLHDLDLIITSYDAGAEKPSRTIFDVAKRQALRLTGSQDESSWVCVHAGDDYAKDYQAAIDAGWEGFYIPREETGTTEHASVRSLTELFDILQAREA